MLRLSKKADYALLAMRHLAANAERDAVSAREVAEAYDIPLELLAKVLQQLVRARLLDSHQGIRGGYGLAKPAAILDARVRKGIAHAVDKQAIIDAIFGPGTIASDTPVWTGSAWGAAILELQTLHHEISRTKR